MAPLALGEVDERRLDARADLVRSGQAELEEDHVDALLDAALAESELVRDRLIAAALGDLAERLQLAVGELSQRGRFGSDACSDQLLDDLRIHDRVALGDRVERGDELLAIVEALLQEVGPSVAAGLEQRLPVARTAYWLTTTTPMSGCVTRSQFASVIPSSSPDGGMRMSVRTTSGRRASIAARSEATVLAHREELDPGSSESTWTIAARNM